MRENSAETLKNGLNKLLIANPCLKFHTKILHFLGLIQDLAIDVQVSATNPGRRKIFTKVIYNSSPVTNTAQSYA